MSKHSIEDLETEIARLQAERDRMRSPGEIAARRHERAWLVGLAIDQAGLLLETSRDPRVAPVLRTVAGEGRDGDDDRTWLFEDEWVQLDGLIDGESNEPTTPATAAETARQDAGFQQREPGRIRNERHEVSRCAVVSAPETAETVPPAVGTAPDDPSLDIDYIRDLESWAASAWILIQDDSFALSEQVGKPPQPPGTPDPEDTP